MRRTLTIPLILLLLAAALVPARAPASAGTTLLPFGPPQHTPRAAYRALFTHISAGNPARWAQRNFDVDGTTYAAGTVIAPGNIAGDAEHLVLSSTLDITPALALDAAGTRIALFRSTVSDPTYGSAAWELADLRETLDTYLWGALHYDILDEHDLATRDLSPYAILIIPAVRRGNEADMLAALGTAALDRVYAFVQAGGFLYAQANGATIAEAAGLVAPGTVDSTSTLHLAPDAPANAGLLDLRDPLSPLGFSWITHTLYLLSDPVYTATADLQTIAEFTNLEGPRRPAILTSAVGLGQVILVDGHPTATTRRAQLPLFFNALLWATGHPAALDGDAVQTYDSQLDPHLLPAYEAGVPISATLTFSNVWDVSLNSTIISETIAAGFDIDPTSITPPATLDALPDGSNRITWTLGDVSPGALRLSFSARTSAPGLQKQILTFADGQATFTLAGRPHRITHRPFTLAARMAARLQTDRDIESDRQYSIPATGIYLDAALPIENKEDTLAAQVIITDVVPLLVPLVGLEDQEAILNQNNGQTVWIRNEPFFYNETTGAPYLPPNGYAVSQTLTLADWDGVTRAAFDVPYGTYATLEPQNAHPRGLGNFITIPQGYTDAITVTTDHRLLLPAKVLTWTLDLWPGYHYEDPAIRYGIHSRELRGRPVTFAGDPGTAPEQIVVQATGGSVYTHLGSAPIIYREHLTSGIVYVPQAPVAPEISYRDVWNREHHVPLRAAFYDLFSWASCACGGAGGGNGEEHAGLNVTFQMRADLSGSGLRDQQVLLYPSRSDGADLDIVIKNRNNGSALAANQMLIDMGMFRGLGVSIRPRSGDWATSWQSTIAATHLISVETSTGYDHLLFQHGVSAGGTDVITLAARIDSQRGPAVEGMLKLHDGARLTYRQQDAGPSRYEIYDTHVQGVLAAATQLQVEKHVTPVQVSTYGDDLYYILTISDPDEPHVLRRNGPGDPFLQSYGFGRLAATTYVGGRDGPQILHSVLAPGDMTRIRVEINNNSGNELRAVTLTPQAPAGISVRPSYPDRAHVPAPIFGDLPFLSLSTIPDAGRGVYYYDLTVEPTYAGPRGQVFSLPITFNALGAPTDFHIPPARIAVDDAGRSAFDISAPAQTLVLTDTLPSYAHLNGAALVSAHDVTALTNATNATARATIFSGLQHTIPITSDGAGGVTFVLPNDALAQLYDLSGAHALAVIARATISPATAGPNLANAGAGVTYRDPLGATWHDHSAPVLVEAHGAAAQVAYTCTNVVSGTLPIGAPGDCALLAGTTNHVAIDVTVTNPGDYPAQNVTATVTLAPNVTFLGADMPPSAIDGQMLSWPIGDLGPGGLRVIHLTAQITLDAYGVPLTIDARHTAPLISRTDGQFIDTFSQRTINAHLGDAFVVPVRVAPDRIGATLQLSYACTSVRWSGGARPAPCVLEPGTTNEIALIATLRNTGRYAASAIQAQLALPPGVVASSTASDVRITPNALAWEVRELAAGTQTSIPVTLTIAIDAALGHTLGGPPTLLPLLTGSSGTFTDAFSERVLALADGAPYALAVRATMPPGGFRTYLPIVLNQVIPPQPDISVRQLSVTPQYPIAGQPARITVVVTNQGTAPAQSFWVDLYLDPQTPPTSAGWRWEQTCRASPCYGIAWQVEALAPGASITLTSDAGRYSAPYSSWPGSFLEPGSHDLYVYADSWPAGTGAGSVLEANEQNNRGSLLGLSVGGTR